MGRTDSRQPGDGGSLLDQIHRHCMGLTSFQEGLDYFVLRGGDVAFQNGGQINQLTILWDRRHKGRGGLSRIPLPYLRCCLRPSAAVFCPLRLSLFRTAAGPLEGLKGEMTRHRLQLAR